MQYTGDCPWFTQLVVRTWPQRRLLDNLARAVALLAAAKILILLAARQRGIGVKDFPAGPDSSPDRLQTALIYLRQLGWMDTHSDTSRVWLTPETKESLAGIVNANVR